MENNKEKGLIITFLAVFVLFFMLALALSMGSIMHNRFQILEDNLKSSQAYYTAESGIEDSLWRLKDNLYGNFNDYDLELGGATALVDIQDYLGGSRTIYSTGDFSDRIKKIKAVYSLSGEGASFYYGAQIGEGGLDMSNGTQILGSVFSNGNITCPTGACQIDNDVIVAGNGNAISGGGMYILGNAKTYSCLSSNIDGNLTYVQGGTNTCSVGGATDQQAEEIETAQMPISQLQIDNLKNEAGADCDSGNYSVSGNQTLGPFKICGTLTINNGVTLKLTGTIYVTGNITVGNGAVVELHTSYGASSGVIVADGIIETRNGSQISGTPGQQGSYLLVISTSSSEGAIDIKNGTNGSVFYTSSGRIRLNNGTEAIGIIGYGLEMKNGATIQYEIGLENAFFSDGPSGSAGVMEWKEE